MIKKASTKEIVDFISTTKTIAEDAKDYFKKKFLDGLENKSKIIYISDEKNSDLLVAIINQEDYDNSFGLIDSTTAYLIYISHDENNINEQKFKELLEYAEQDLKKNGFKNLTIGVDISNAYDLKIIFHHGFLNFVKYSFRPLKDQNDYKNNALVAYYQKTFN